MNPEFQIALEEFLMRYQMVGIPKLGKFYMVKQNKATNTADVIQPIKYNVEHQTNGQENLSRFEDFVMNMFQFGKTRAKEFIKQSVDQIYEELNPQKNLVLNNFGEFSMHNGEIRFQAYNDLINDQSYGLPVVKLIPIIRTYKEKTDLLDSYQHGKVDSNLKKSNIWEIILALFLALVIVGLLGLLFNVLLTDKHSIPTDNEKISVDGMHNENSGETVAFLSDSSEFSTQNDAKISMQLDTYKHEIIIPLDQPEEILENAYDKSCIIIVGSFKQLSNRDNLVIELENMGYDVHTENFGSYNRVGVNFDCLTNDLYNMLFVLRGKIDEGAWILKY